MVDARAPTHRGGALVIRSVICSLGWGAIVWGFSRAGLPGDSVLAISIGGGVFVGFWAQSLERDR